MSFNTGTGGGSPFVFGSPANQQTTPTNVFGGIQQNTGFNFSGAAAGGGVFGTQQSNATSNVFGGGGVFGKPLQNATATTNLFSSQPQQPTGTSVKFVPYSEKDTMAVKSGNSQVMKSVNVHHQCITVMAHYQNKSLEELRLEDYQLQRHKKGLTGGVFGTTTATPPAPVNLFSSGFGTPKTTAATTPTFGATGLFGSSTAFGSGLFSTTGSQNQQKPCGLFGGTTATTPAFGTGSVFGTTNATTGTTGFGTGSGFSFPNQQQPQQTQGFGLFSQPSATTSSTAKSNVFGSGGLFGTTSTTKPLFGSTPAPTATGFSFGSFGATPATTTTASSSNTIFGSGLFSSAGTPQQQQQSNPFTLQTSAFKPPTTAGLPTFGVASAPATTATTGGLGGFFNPGQQQQRPATGLFTSGFGGNSFSGGNQFRPLFGAQGGTATSFGGLQRGTLGFQPQQQSNNYQQESLYMTPGPISFATSPFKDNPLFYNLISSTELPKYVSRRRKLVPTETESNGYLEATSPQRMRNYGSGSGPSHHAALRRFSYYSKDSRSRLTKYKAFDGFEDEDFGVHLNVLSPKTDVKRLNLTSLEEPLSSILVFSKDKKKSSMKSSVGMARRSTEILLEREKAAQNELSTPKSHPISPLLENRRRRVRFTLPSLASSNGDNSLPSPILYSTGHDDNTGFGNSSENFSSYVETQQQTQSLETPQRQLPPPPRGICGVISTREGYYLKPSLAELDEKTDGEGNCVVIGLEIGRKNFGCIKYLSSVNIAKINIDKLVHFRHKEVIVYPDDNQKPELGKGLNAPAEIRLERVWPVDKETNELLRNPDHPMSQNYDKRLQKSCKRMGAEFVSYNQDEGVWIFRVSQF